MDKLDIAVHDSIHDSKIKSKEIAELMGKSHQVLINKGNPNCDTHHLTLQESVALMRHTGNMQILQTLNAMFNQGEYEKPNKHKTVMSALLHSMKEHGDIGIAIEKAFVDKRITAREKAEIIKEIREEVDSLRDLEWAVDSLQEGYLRAI